MNNYNPASNTQENELSSCPIPVEPVFTSTSASISFSGGTATGPGFDRNYTLVVPAGNIYTIAVSADDSVVVSGEGISAESHWDSTKKCIVPGEATSEYVEVDSTDSYVPFSVTYKNKGGPYSLSVVVTSSRTSSQVARSTNDQLFENKQCLGNYLLSKHRSIANALFKQWLKQMGYESSAFVLPWEPTEDNPYGWRGTTIPPEVIYTGENYSIKAGLDFDISTGAIGLGVDVYTQSGTVDCSAGIRLSSDGGASASITIKF